MAVDTSAGGEDGRPLPRVWLIAGPTASGKSALALALAERVGGEIVNADALQLYRDLSVLTARPTPRDETRARHHLYGVADARDAWSVGRWLRVALPVLAEVRGRGRTPIVVGGTGLYFTALTRGLAQTPAVTDAVRDVAAARFDQVGEAAFRAGLGEVDPEAAARIAPGDRQRLVRAAAVHAATGRSLSAWRARTSPQLAADDWRGVVLQPDRAELYARCDARVDAMVAAGAVEEAARLEARSLPPGLPALKAVGYREFAAAARGEVTLAQAREAAARETRRYAKRQSTWFRNQTPDWPRIESLDPDRQAAALFAELDRPA